MIGVVEAICECPQLELIVVGAGRRLRHLHAPMRLDGARHVHDAKHGDLAIVPMSHLYLRPACVDVRHAPDAVLQSRFFRTPLHLEVGLREHETYAVVLMHEQPVPVEREHVINDQFVLVTCEGDGEVSIGQHHPAGVGPVVGELSMVQRVVWGDGNLRSNVRQKPVKIAALETLLDR